LSLYREALPRENERKMTGFSREKGNTSPTAEFALIKSKKKNGPYITLGHSLCKPDRKPIFAL
jgi:hypothetical protein